jgi:hypothetical protein
MNCLFLKFVFNIFGWQLTLGTKTGNQSIRQRGLLYHMRALLLQNTLVFKCRGSCHGLTILHHEHDTIMGP